MKYLINIRVWLLRKLSMGRPIVMNVAIDGCVDMREADHWGLVADCHIDASSSKTVLTTKK